MNKLYTLVLALFCLNFSAMAQLPDGSVAPDFTVTDLEGNEHNLYDLLNDGKTVIIDLFATWCGPCWSFHQNHTLADLYDKMGPDGTDEIMVIAIESDGATNGDCLYGPSGCNSTTYGDWTEGVPYPIADTPMVFRDYDAGYYPTIFTIFPNRLVYESGQMGLSSYESYLAANMPQLEAGAVPNILTMDVLSGTICSDTETSPTYLINNQGDEAITSADISVLVNDVAQYEEAWTGEVNSWGIVSEVISPVLTITENSIIQFRMDNINGNSDNSFVHESEVIRDVSNSITVSIKTDAEAGTSFSILSIFGVQVADELLDQPNTEYEFNYALEDLRCHIFTLLDEGQNGINETGSVEVKDDLGNIIFDNRDFGSGTEFVFNASVNTGVNDILTDVDVSISPNPVSDNMTVNIHSEEGKQLQLSVLSISGELLHTVSFKHDGHSQRVLELSDLASGLYFLNINDGQGQLTQKFIKE